MNKIKSSCYLFFILNHNSGQSLILYKYLYLDKNYITMRQIQNFDTLEQFNADNNGYDLFTTPPHFLVLY